MSILQEVKARGLDMNYNRYLELTKSDRHPHGLLPVSGDATDEEIQEWQSEFDRTGELSPQFQLTRDETNLAKWIVYSEEARVYNENNKEIPKALEKKASRLWADDFRFKEPKQKKRKQTIQMFLSLPPALTGETGYPAGILWRTADDPKSVQELSAMVCEAFPESTYKNDPVGRIKTDINKHNKGIFPCMSVGDQTYTPDEPYPMIDPELEAKKKEQQEGLEEISS